MFYAVKYSDRHGTHTALYLCNNVTNCVFLIALYFIVCTSIGSDHKEINLRRAIFFFYFIY